MLILLSLYIKVLLRTAKYRFNIKNVYNSSPFHLMKICSGEESAISGNLLILIYFLVESSAN